MRGRERLSMALQHLEHDYEVVIVDCPPSLGNLTDNALLACRHILIPALAEGTSIRALEILFDRIDTLEQGFEVEIDDVGVIANRVENDGEAEETMDWFEGTFSGRQRCIDARCDRRGRERISRRRARGPTGTRGR